MEFKYSVPGKVPYIEVNQHFKLIFSEINKDFSRGYKYITATGYIEERLKKGKGDIDLVQVPISFSTNCFLEKIPNDVKSIFKPFIISKLKRIFKKFITNEMYISSDDVDKVREIVNAMNWDEPKKKTHKRIQRIKTNKRRGRPKGAKNKV